MNAFRLYRADDESIGTECSTAPDIELATKNRRKKHERDVAQLGSLAPGLATVETETCWECP